MKKILAAFVAASIIALASIPIAAEGAEASSLLAVQGFYGLPNLGGLGAAGFAPVEFGVDEGGAGERDLGSSWGSAAAKVSLSRKFVVPALAGDGPLTEGNNLAVEIAGSLTPVSLNAELKAALTPIAFLKFAAGASAGTGWSLGFVGLGLNPADNALPVAEKPLGGIVWDLWASGTFQFDMAAIVPGEWNHVVIVASPELRYKAFTDAEPGEAWVWEADSGMNFNGLKLEGSYFLGYQPPLALNTVGILVEPDAWLGEVRGYAPMAGAAGTNWGSDFTELSFGPVFNFALGERSSLAVVFQFGRAIKWTDATTKNRYFGDRAYEDGYTYFDRIAFSYGLSL